MYVRLREVFLVESYSTSRLKMTVPKVLLFLACVAIIAITSIKCSPYFGETLTVRDEAENEACQFGLVDAATRTQDGSSYLFKGDYYWKIIYGGVANGYPRLIAEDWKGLGFGAVDAAFTWNDGSTFFFKGDQYWRFVNREPEDGFPKKITEGFRGIPDNVDAALVWENNGLTYFFKGSQYWRYSPQLAVPTSGKYPAQISAWIGVPNNVTAAIRWEGGLTYFFRGSQYYKYDNKLERVPRDYPTETSPAWFECSNSSRADRVNIFERERPSQNETEIANLEKSVEESRNMLEKISSAQNLTLSKLEFLMESVAKTERIRQIISNKYHLGLNSQVHNEDPSIF